MIRKNVAHLVLIRHCETSWNAQHRVQGSVDIPLNERGKTQACELSFVLSKETFHAIYSSHLQRARQTAEIIAFHHPCEVIVDEGLMEGCYGEAEGLHVDDYHAKYKEEELAYSKLSREEKLKATIVPDAETRWEIFTRVGGALRRLSHEHFGERILVVTHGGVLRSLLMALSDEFDPPPFLYNGAQVHLLCDGENLHIHSIQQPAGTMPVRVTQ